MPADSQQGTVEAPITLSAIVGAPIVPTAAIEAPVVLQGTASGSSGGSGKGDPVEPDGS